MKTIFDQLAARQPQLFSAADIRVDKAQLEAMAELVGAIETVLALPAFRAEVLARAPESARWPVAARSVLMGYDFHLTPDGPKLIEINTNAGGGLLNAYLLAAHGHADEAAAFVAEILDMFRAEWRLERGDSPLTRIAIVDEAPAGQFLAPEFELFRDLFTANGIDAVIADPADFVRDGNRLLHDGKPIDLIYNRLTDFYLDAAVHRDIREVFAAGGVVLTPHPAAHATHADKRHLMLLSDPQKLADLAVDPVTQQIVLAGVPRTIAVDPAQAETLWAGRKRWFFKPPTGFGSRAAYRGDKLTKRVFDEILAGHYIAQEIAPPSEHEVIVNGEPQTMKADFRCFVYDGHIQCIAARLYQGQTTNFRTPGGGFAPVFAA
jgi:hypothetical protein